MPLKMVLIGATRKLLSISSLTGIDEDHISRTIKPPSVSDRNDGITVKIDKL